MADAEESDIHRDEAEMRLLGDQQQQQVCTLLKCKAATCMQALHT